MSSQYGNIWSDIKWIDLQQFTVGLVSFRTLLNIGGSYVSFWIIRAIYRLFFHSLVRYPGPRLAAVSKPWYEWYWNVHQKGQLLFEIERQHQKLGPVIRIAPNELHINDPEVYLDITKVGSHFTKDRSFYKFITFPGTLVGETNAGKHRIRRAVLTPAFSPTRVQELASMVEVNVDQLLSRFEEFEAEGKPVNIFAGMKAFTMDIISKIVFGRELGCIQDPVFKNQFIEYLHSTFDMGWTATAFPNLAQFSLSLPEWLSEVLFPIPLMEFKKKCIILIDAYVQARKVPTIRHGSKSTLKEEYNNSVVTDRLVNPESAKDHSTLNASQLAEEVIMLLSAGNDTTSDAMIVGVYQILRNPKIHQKLNDELSMSFPSLHDDITYEKAKKLTYLTAVLKETLRYSNPLPGRVARAVPPEGYNLHGHILPFGTVITTSAYLLNRHSDIWLHPDSFLPERWLEKDASRLEKYMTSFYRGTRQCLGKDLAFCELYVLFARLFRRFDLEIYNTTDDDMQWIDLLLTVFTGNEFHAKVHKRSL